jgi:hypothetical protein
MKKTLLVAIMAVIMIAFASCGGNNGHSKAFNQAKKIYDNMIEEVNKANTCDDVDMAAFGVLGLLGVEGIDKLDEAETKELEELGEKLSKAMEDKKAALDCQDDYSSWWDDEEVPVDEEPVEAE